MLNFKPDYKFILVLPLRLKEVKSSIDRLAGSTLSLENCKFEKDDCSAIHTFTSLFGSINDNYLFYSIYIHSAKLKQLHLS